MLILNGTVSDHNFVTKFYSSGINFFEIFKALASVKAKQFLENLTKNKKLQ